MKTSALTQAGIDRLHQAMTARVKDGGLPGIVTLVAQGDDVNVDVIGTMAFGSALASEGRQLSVVMLR